MGRYLTATGGDTRKAMTLYRYNLHLSQQVFTIVSCFEVALRNAIDREYSARHGIHWLRSAASPGGMFNNRRCQTSANLIQIGLRRLNAAYTPGKLIAEMDFGFWRYLFAQPQFFAGGQVLLTVFPSKPRSTPAIQYNHRYIFRELEQVNHLRNRLAHHEAICFRSGQSVIDTVYARQHHALIMRLFLWMNIDAPALLYGLDHVIPTCNKIDEL